MTGQIHVCSRKEFQWLLREGKVNPEESCALISSSYPLDIPEVSPIRHCFRLYEDIDYDCPGRSFTPEAAGQFARAIRQFRDIPFWYFVCDGGCRRSAAVACSALRYWNREKEELALWQDPRREPNAWVYAHMCDALGVPIDDRELDHRIHINRTAIKTALGKR